MKQLATTLVALALVDVAFAQALALRCDGDLGLYENGFGKPTAQQKSTRIVTIDRKAGLATMDTLFGERSAALVEDSGGRRYTFIVKHNRQFGDKLIATEAVNLNRYTGELSSVYYFDPPEPDGTFYVAFRGICQMAAPKF